jgi:hypothetical protein
MRACDIGAKVGRDHRARVSEDSKGNPAHGVFGDRNRPKMIARPQSAAHRRAEWQKR